AAGVAHEMNNPLTYAMLNLQKVHGVLAARRDDSELHALQESVTFAIEALQRMRDIVRDLMDVARDDGERVGVSLHGVLESSLRIAQHHIEPRARVIRSYGDVPPVRAVVSRLGQVFVNLLVNAAQSMPAGRPDANELRISTTSDELGSAIVEIADTGSGIPPDLLQRVFDPFVTTKSDGTGLGLFLCKRLVSSMGGELTVVKTGADGTTMQVRLLAAKPA
ncbi:MAG: sensor histidine kinase, partial [Polyangiaceae bacterium]